MKVIYDSSLKTYQVQNIPEGMQLMFFGKIDDMFIVIIAQPDRFPKDIDEPFELDGKAQIAIGDTIDVDLQLQEVHHGHKHVPSGGFVEFGGTCASNRERVSFKNDSEAVYNGTKIDEVFFTS